jgi:hypothetical protein
MKEYAGHGDTGRFLGLWATLTNAAFSYGGVEMVAVAAGEAEDPRRNIPKAVRRVFWRILFFYVLGSWAIGVTVPANDRTPYALIFILVPRLTGYSTPYPPRCRCRGLSVGHCNRSRRYSGLAPHYQCGDLDQCLLVRQCVSSQSTLGATNAN